MNLSDVKNDGDFLQYALEASDEQLEKDIEELDRRKQNLRLLARLVSTERARRASALAIIEKLSRLKETELRATGLPEDVIKKVIDYKASKPVATPPAQTATPGPVIVGTAATK